MHEELQSKRAVTEQLSRDLEDPGNLVRWRALEGEDPDMDQLRATITVGVVRWASLTVVKKGMCEKHRYRGVVRGGQLYIRYRIE